MQLLVNGVRMSTDCRVTILRARAFPFRRRRNMCDQVYGEVGITLGKPQVIGQAASTARGSCNAWIARRWAESRP